MTLTLSRHENTPDGVFGILSNIPGGLILHTVEDDWLENRRGVSCIPAGTYELHRTIFYRHGYETFEVMGVPDRQRILIHPANTEEDVEGCIGVGLRNGLLRVRDEDDPAHPFVTKRAVVASQEAFHQFMAAMKYVDRDYLVVSAVP